ncbi:hypothetical protein C1645_745621 [Glomus cerebriforme]|uniref:Uncharacterized protein n=1 Tax=Glomus cerebriforme TaxID=658196 RepID=A0A397S6D4_9GLOM|nr:hypothetical protein C1645_745621 [Glomus cerebriforme]
MINIDNLILANGTISGIICSRIINSKTVIARRNHEEGDISEFFQSPNDQQPNQFCKKLQNSEITDEIKHDDDDNEVKEMCESRMQKEKKWFLKSDRYVEDALYAFGKQYQFEQLRRYHWLKQMKSFKWTANIKHATLEGVNLYERKFELRPEKNITGPNGHGPVDFAIDLLQSAKTVGMTEVKNEDFYKDIAQNAVQFESALSNHKRKASEMEEGDVFTEKTFGIITDVKKWYFIECSLDNEEKSLFKLSKLVVVVYGTESMKGNVKRVLRHIAWLLEEVQKSDPNEERVVKKHRHRAILPESQINRF